MIKIREKILKYLGNHLYFTITLAFITFFHFYALPGDLFNADQHFWFQRTTNFIKAIKSANFEETFQNPKPGVTVMILSGLSLESFWTLYEAVYGFRPLIYTYDTYSFIDFAVKAPLVLMALISMIIFYKYFSPIFGEKVTLIALILFGLSPYYTAVSRLFHGDGTMNAFFLICIILLIYYFKNYHTKFLILSAVSAGAAFLAKSQAIFLIPYIFLISGLSYIVLKNPLKMVLKNIGIWLVTFFVTIYLLFPAMWATPVKTFWKIFDEGLTVANEGRNSNYGNNDIFYYFVSLNWITNPIFLALSIFGILLFIYNYKQEYNEDRYKFFTYLAILMVIIFYFLQMTLVVQKSNRYISTLVPYLSIFGAYLVFKINKTSFKTVFFTLLTISVFYISYFSPYLLALYETQNWGSLANKAANYLNEKESSHNFNVVISPKEHTFRPFVKGKFYSPREKIPNDNKADYLIIGSKETVPQKLTHCTFEKDIEFRGKLFWKIYNCK